MAKIQKLVVIEDDAALTKALSQAFLNDGYEIFPAVDGETGLRLIEEKKPDLVVLDIILPIKNGFEIMEELSRREDLKNIPVVVLTNLESGENINRMTELGAKAYLVKANYSLNEIAAKIKEILNRFNKNDK